jgi:hypothetical protein
LERIALNHPHAVSFTAGSCCIIKKGSQNDPENTGNEINPGDDQVHFVRVEMPAMMRHEIARDAIK